MHHARLLAATLALAVSTAHAAYTLVPYDSRGTGGPADSIAIGDVNGDGRVDVVAAVGFADDEQYSRLVLVHLQQADGSFAVALKFPFLPPGRSALAIGNLDGDTAQEIVVGAFGGITILDWDPSRRAGAAPSVTSRTYTNQWGKSGENLVLLDADRDGALDVVGKDVGADMIVHLGDGQGGIRKMSRIPMGISMYNDLTSGDFNDDGYTDFAVLSSVSRAYIYLNNGTEAFVLPPIVVNPNPTGANFYPALAAGDFDGDGRDDLVLSSGAWKLSLYTQTAAHDFTLLNTMTTQEAPAAVLGYDFDLDGRDDLLMQPLKLYMQTDSGLSEQPFLGFPSGATRNGLAAGDIDGDGCPDLAVASDQGMAVYRGVGCLAVADLAVSLGLTDTVAAVRLDNFGAIAAAAPQTTLTLSISKGTFSLGALPVGCTISAQDARSAQVACSGADLAAGNTRTLLVPVSVASDDRRTVLKASASATTTTADVHQENNTARKSVSVGGPIIATRRAGSAR